MMEPASARTRRLWLLEIGQRLKAEYDELVAAPIPPRLVALVQQLECAAKPDSQNHAEPSRSADD
jgi:hypothetical protein